MRTSSVDTDDNNDDEDEDETDGAAVRYFAVRAESDRDRLLSSSNPSPFSSLICCLPFYDIQNHDKNGPRPCYLIVF